MRKIIEPPFGGAKQIVGERQLAILTELTLYESTVLDEGESGLTGPVYLFDLGAVRPGQVLHTRYVFGEQPGLRCQLVSPPPRVSTLTAARP